MSRRGFTLIEVMVSMVILSVGLLAVLKMAFVYVQTNLQNMGRGYASVLAQDKMEQLRSYAVSDRVDKFGVFDFDYLVSTNPAFTTIYDPGATADISIPGLLSGSNGGSVPVIPWGTVYEVLYDDGATGGDEASGDGIYTNSDTVTVNNVVVSRLFTVEPYYPTPAKPTFATITVKTWWTDKAGTKHEMTLKSVVNRRQ